MKMERINVKDLLLNPFEAISDQWMLITAEKDGKANTMTASWVGVGIMWGKNIATAYIRPQRYTKEFVDYSDTFTLSFFGGREKKALGHLGSVSGRDEPDKIEQAGLHLTKLNGHPTFEEATLVFVCRKMYAQEMKAECFLDQEQIKKWYPDSDFHTMYMAEIIEAYQQK